MTTGLLCALSAFAALVTFMMPLSAAAQTREHTVREILLDGKSVEWVNGATVSRRAMVEHAVRRGEPIPDGTRVDVPAHVELIITSTGGKSAVTLPPGSSVTFITTDQGEWDSVNAGDPIFSDVPGALDYFHVQAGRDIDAAAAGTTFSVAVGYGSVTVHCTQGELSVQKTGYLRVGLRRYKASLIDTLSPARGAVTYHPSETWYLATFATFGQAEAYYRRQLATARQTGSAVAVANALDNIGIVQDNQSRYADALRSYAQALALFQQLGDRGGETSVLNNIGVVQETQGEYADALRSYQQALMLSEELGDRDYEANALDNIGIVQGDQRQFTDALRSFQRALALYRQLGDQDGEADALVGAGNVQVSPGTYGNALQSDQQALTLYRRLRDRDGEARVLDGIGFVQWAQGKYAAALQSYQQALGIARQLGDRDAEARLLYHTGVIQEAQGQFPTALQSFEQSFAISTRIGDQNLSAITTAEIEMLRSRLPQAQTQTVPSPAPSPTPSTPADPCGSLLSIVNRPTVSTGVCTVRTGHVDVESGYVNTTTAGTRGGSSALYPQALLRIGTFDPHLDVEFSLPSYQASSAGQRKVDGTSDISVAVKYALANSSKADWGFYGAVTLPTGSTAFTADHAQYTGDFDWSYTIDSEFSFEGTFSFNDLSGVDAAAIPQSYFAFIPSLELSAALPGGPSQLSAEYAYSSVAGPGLGSKSLIDIVYQRDFGRHLQLDAEYGFSPTQIVGQRQRYVGAGLSFMN